MKAARIAAVHATCAARSGFNARWQRTVHLGTAWTGSAAGRRVRVNAVHVWQAAEFVGWPRKGRTQEAAAEQALATERATAPSAPMASKTETRPIGTAAESALRVK